jgi:hypothetical protein
MLPEGTKNNLRQLRYNFIIYLCDHFNVSSLDELYEKDSINFVRNITQLSINKIPCREILEKLTPYMCNKAPLEMLYHVLYDFYEENPVKCKCGTPTKFTNELTKGYRKYCSNNCRRSDYNTIVKKAHATYFNKTGYKNPSQNPVVKEKKIETTLKNYGCKHINYNEEIVKNRQLKYFDKTGYLHPFANPEIKQKIKDTYLQKTGYENPSFNPDVIQKRANTYRIRTGFDCSLQNPKIQEIIRQKHIERFGVDNPAKSIEIQQKMSRTQFIHFFEKLISNERLKNLYLPIFSIDEYSGVKGKRYLWKCLKCNTEFDDDIDNGNLPRCPTCYPVAGTSLIEKEIINFCQQYYEIKTNSRDLIPPYEIDIYIPEIKLGIEFNGLYWHGELTGRKAKEYHQNKLLLALQNQINLVQIFEDEWIEKQDIVKSILLNKFNKSQNKVFARKCQIYSVPVETAKKFYDNNHIQGFINGYHLGLYYNDEFVSMMTVGKPRFDNLHELEIYRFCNKIDTNVPGGLSRLLKAIIIDKSIITYADARYGLGLGYYKCGFKFSGTTEPGYSYVKIGKRKRISRLQFQKHLLIDKLEMFDPNLTEWENMQLNGYDRVWDCGNFVYEINN